MTDMYDKHELECAVARYRGDLQLLVVARQAQLDEERKGHAAEIRRLKIELEKLKIEHARDLQQVKQVQQHASEQQSTILATTIKNHAAEHERLKTEHARDLQRLRKTHARDNENRTAIAARTSQNRDMVESALRKAIGDAKLECQELQTRSDYQIARLQQSLAVAWCQLRDAEHSLAERKFIGQDEWDKLRKELQKAKGELYGASKERDIFHAQLREVGVRYAKKSKEVTASALVAATATQRLEEVQAQLTRKNEELVKTLARNGVLEALARKVQADIDERDQALSKAEKERSKAVRELERLKRRIPGRQVIGFRQDNIKKEGEIFDKFTSKLQELHDARVENEKLTEKLKNEETRAIKATRNLSKIKGAVKALNEELAASKLEAHTTSTELSMIKKDLEEAQKTSAEAQESLKATRQELSELKGADAKIFLSSDIASKTQKELTAAKTELKNTQTALTSLQSDLGDARAELSKLKAERTEREAAFQKYIEIGTGLELEVNGLRQINAGLVNSSAELGNTRAQLGSVQAGLGDVKAELSNAKAELFNAKAELLGLKAQQAGQEAALQTCQENGRLVELQGNNLQQMNTNLEQEINSLKMNLEDAQAEAASLRQSQQHGSAKSTGQVDPSNMTATIEDQDPSNFEDDAMGDDHQLWEDVLPGLCREDPCISAKEDQKMEEGEGEVANPMSHEGDPPDIVPGVLSGDRQLDDLDLDLLGETDSNEAEPRDVISSAFTIPQFNFMAPQNIAWPPPETNHSLKVSQEIYPKEQPTFDGQDTARLIEEALEKDLENLNDKWSEPIPGTPQAGPELIYGDYLPAAQPVPQQTISSLSYGAKPQTHAQVSQAASPSMSAGETHTATPPGPQLPGLFYEVSSQARTAIDLQSEPNNQQVSRPPASNVHSSRAVESMPVFDPTLMSLNDWTLPQEEQIQSAMANFVPEPFVPTAVPKDVAYPISPFSATPRSSELVGALTRAMNNVMNPSPYITSSAAESPPKNLVRAFSQAMYEVSKTPSHTRITNNAPPSLLASLIKPTAQMPTVSQVHSQALRPMSRYSEAEDRDPRSKRLTNHADASSSQHPRFDLGVMNLPGASGHAGFSQKSPHYAVQTASTSQYHPGSAAPKSIRQGVASLSGGAQPYVPDVATLSALLGHRAPVVTTTVPGISFGPSVPIFHPRHSHARTEDEGEGMDEAERVLREQVVIDPDDESTEDEDETVPERKARMLAKLAPGGHRKIAKLRKRTLGV